MVRVTGARRMTQILCRDALHRSPSARPRQSASQKIGQGTVDWQPNFDGSLNEPFTAGSGASVLLNGGTGIAVGMATDLPPSHNLTEVVNGAVALLENPKLEDDELFTLIPGARLPDPAEIITPAKDIQAIYQSGRGSIRTRAKWHLEDGDIVIDTLPLAGPRRRNS